MISRRAFPMLSRSLLGLIKNPNVQRSISVGSFYMWKRLHSFSPIGDSGHLHQAVLDIGFSSHRMLSTAPSSSTASDSLDEKIEKSEKARKELQEQVAAQLNLPPVLPVSEGAEAKGSFLKRFSLKVARFPVVVVCKTGSALKLLFTHPIQFGREAKQLIAGGWSEVKHACKGYYLGSKLLFLDVRTAFQMTKRLALGHALSRRERRQLLRTLADVLRVVPFSIFIIVPFMEILIPFVVAAFPGFLPSTFQKPLKKEGKLKRQLTARIRMAQFLQDTMREMAKDIGRKRGEETAEELLDLVENLKRGTELPVKQIVRCARIFRDDITLDNLSRPQLVGMCNIMHIRPFGSDGFLRFQLRSKIRKLKSDDQDILWEGIDSLSTQELQTACHERGMRSSGLSVNGYRAQLKHWLDLSVSKEVPASLLILSRAFAIQDGVRTSETHEADALRTSISTLDEDIVREAVVEAVARGEDLAALKIETVRHQNERIIQERKQKKKKAEKELANLHEHFTATGVHEESLKEDLGMTDRLKDMDDIVQPSSAPRRVTREEMEAVTAMMEQSGVELEREALKLLQQSQSDIEVEAVIAQEVPKPTKVLLKKLDKIVSKLELDLNKADEIIGNQLHRLDLDDDGIMTVEEIVPVIRELLVDRASDLDAAIVATSLDEDSDGHVSVKDVRRLLRQSQFSQKDISDPVTLEKTRKKQ